MQKETGKKKLKAAFGQNVAIINSASEDNNVNKQI